MYKVDLYTRQPSQVLMMHNFLQVELQKMYVRDAGL